MDHQLKIVLITPEIPGNTGSIGRTALALNAELILIKPLAFDLSEKEVRRAGLDYWKHVRLKVYDHFEHYLETEFQSDHSLENKMYFFTKTAVSRPIFQSKIPIDAHLIFGPETKGIPQKILDQYPNQQVSFPMNSPHIRSLNLANVATAALYEAIRQNFYQN